MTRWKLFGWFMVGNAFGLAIKFWFAGTINAADVIAVFNSVYYPGMALALHWWTNAPAISRESINQGETTA